MPSSPPDDSVKLFLSYAREDFDAVSALYDRLKALGLRPWMDKRDLLPGQRWRDAIVREVKQSDLVLVCLSPQSVDKRGFFQREMRTALDAWQEKRQDDIYLIPVRLAACEVPEELAEFNWVDLYEQDGWKLLLRAVEYAAGRLGRPVPAELAKALTSKEPLPTTPVQAASPDVLTLTAPIRLELVRVPAGEFLMGSDPTKDKNAYDDEKPQHRLVLPEFYIGKYPVTNEQYAAFVEQTKSAAPSHWQGEKIPTGKERHPVVNVSWHEAREFCEWVSRETGEVIRLPSEAEWEKTARGLDGRLYPWGNQAPTGELCNFYGSKIRDTTPVDRYPKGASPYGALDMVGNVLEWTSSLFKSYPYNPTDGREDESGSGWRVVRGGSYRSNDKDVRCAFRDDLNPFNRYGTIGLRLVLLSPPS